MSPGVGCDSTAQGNYICYEQQQFPTFWSEGGVILPLHTYLEQRPCEKTLTLLKLRCTGEMVAERSGRHSWLISV